MNPNKELEKIDMLFDAVAADLEQLKLETVKLESHMLNLVAHVTSALSEDRDDPQRP